MKVIRQLFPVPTLEATVDNYDSLNKKLIKEITELFDSGVNRRVLSHKWNEYKFSTQREELGYSNFDPLDNNGLVGDDRFNFFFDQLSPLVNEFFSQLHYRQQWYFLNAWAAVYPKGAWVPLHDHRPCHWSGVYYVKTHKNCGNIIFTDPKEYALSNEPEQTLYRGNAMHTVEPTDGMLLLWPSYMKHETLPNQIDEDRIIISFNIITTGIPDPDGKFLQK